MKSLTLFCALLWIASTIALSFRAQKLGSSKLFASLSPDIQYEKFGPYSKFVSASTFSRNSRQEKSCNELVRVKPLQTFPLFEVICSILSHLWARTAVRRVLYLLGLPGGLRHPTARRMDLGQLQSLLEGERREKAREYYFNQLKSVQCTFFYYTYYRLDAFCSLM